MRLRLCFLAIMLTPFLCIGQSSFEKFQSIALENKVTLAAVDRPGDLYLLSSAGDLLKITAQGLREASAKLNATPTVFDPRDGAHLFAYWRNSQTYAYLLPDLEPQSESQVIDSALALNPFLLAPFGDHDLVLLDSADWSLKKVDGKSNTVMYETMISKGDIKGHDLLILKEYQNFIFLLDQEKGIRVFNMMGRLLKTIGEPGINYFAFLGGEVYYLKNDTLEFFDLFTADRRTVKLPARADFAFLTDERLYLVRGNTLDIYISK